MSGHMKTPTEARAALRRRGIPISRWARDNGVPRAVAYGVLSGKLVGTYGHAHRAAVILGLKDGDIK